MRRSVMVLLAVFAVSLGVVVGNRLSAEAMAVVVGVVCGVAAGLPVSALILVLSQRWGRREVSPRPEGYPPVVVINPGGQSEGAWRPAYLPPPMYQQPMPRQFKVVGEDWIDEEG